MFNPLNNPDNFDTVAEVLLSGIILLAFFQFLEVF